MELSSCAMSFLLNLLSRWFDALIAIPFIKGVLNLVSRWFNAFIAIPFVKGFWWRSVGFYLWLIVHMNRYHRYLLGFAFLFDLCRVYLGVNPALFAIIFYAFILAKNITVLSFIEYSPRAKEAIDRNLSTEFLRSLGLKNSPLSALAELFGAKAGIKEVGIGAISIVVAKIACDEHDQRHSKAVANHINQESLKILHAKLVTRGESKTTYGQVAEMYDQSRAEATSNLTPSRWEMFFGNSDPASRKLNSLATSTIYPHSEDAGAALTANEHVQRLESLIKIKDTMLQANRDSGMAIIDFNAASIAEPHASWLDILGLPSEAVLGSFPLGLELYVVIMCALLSLSVSWTRSPFMNKQQHRIINREVAPRVFMCSLLSVSLLFALVFLVKPFVL